MSQGSHENLNRAASVAPGTDRGFGFVMAGAFLIVSLVSLWRNGTLWPWTFAIAALFLAVTLMHAPLLRPLNLLWFKFGMLLHRIVNPLVMGLLFFGTVLPIGLALRAARKDLLGLLWDRQADSYWIVRRPPGPAPETMKDQF
jgi:hypothetical protein